jgi:hypothetical protein
MRHYCTLFDRKYLPQGVALYESLERHSSEPFTLWVLALDVETRDALERLNLSCVAILDGEAFEDGRQLTAIRQSRTHQEWCWMLASQLCEYLLFDGLMGITYLDADTFFFSDPEPVFEEIGARSIAITPHRLIPSKKHLEVNGLFNVGFVHFKNTGYGRRCVERWAAQCREKCSATDGCGDQKYLDEWPSLYGMECCAIENIGVNAGPWSIANWKVTTGPRLDGVQFVCYHAHEFDLEAGRLTYYELRQEDREFIYAPYLEAVQRAKQRIGELAVR